MEPRELAARGRLYADEGRHELVMIVTSGLRVGSSGFLGKAGIRRRSGSWIRVRFGAVRALFAVVCVVTFALLAAGGTSAAAKQLGGAAPGGGACSAGYWHAQIGEATASDTVPAGVWRLTSWSMWGSSGSVSFLVLRPAAGTASRVVYAAAAPSTTVRTAAGKLGQCSRTRVPA